jgi:hypothetical protein
MQLVKCEGLTQRRLFEPERLVVRDSVSRSENDPEFRATPLIEDVAIQAGMRPQIGLRFSSKNGLVEPDAVRMRS